MSLLDEIAKAAAARRNLDAQERARSETSTPRIAEAQRIAFARWEREMVPAITSAASKLNNALGGRATGDYLDTHSELSSLLPRGQVALGEQKSLTLKYIRGARPSHLIKFALVGKPGPDPVVLVISRDNRQVVSLVVDQDFKLGTLEYFLERTVRDIEAAQ